MQLKRNVHEKFPFPLVPPAAFFRHCLHSFHSFSPCSVPRSSNFKIHAGLTVTEAEDFVCRYKVVDLVRGVRRRRPGTNMIMECLWGFAGNVVGGL
jgi:hypothetical protein